MPIPALTKIFHFDEIHAILGEVVCGGLVVETNVSAIVAAINESKRTTQRRGLMRAR
jgi:AP-3 complex subunit sigma